MPVYQLHPMEVLFPKPVLAEPDGLLAVGGDLSPKRLIAAYVAGIFPWYGEGSPILWWSPDPRCILLPEEFHLPRSLGRTLRSGVFSLTMDADFAGVIAACAAPRPYADSTWLVPEMVRSYTALYHIGLAHSVEAWQDGELAGGLYGVSLGSVFFGESMFFRRPDAGKAALAHLVHSLREAGFTLIDCQQETANLLRFGAKAVSRQEFLERLDAALAVPTRQGSWRDGIPLQSAH